MKKVKAIIERGQDGTFDVYIDPNENAGFGLLGQGASVKEAVEDFLGSRDEMQALHEEEGKAFPELEFEYVYDVPAFLSYYAGVLTLSGLEKVTGVNQRQLSHYANGAKRPRPETAQKIERALHAFSEELGSVRFCSV
jgi:hypothetical protein